MELGLHGKEEEQNIVLCGEGDGTPLRCSCLENPRDGGAWSGISWSSLGGLKGVKPPEAFGERSRDWSLALQKTKALISR